MLLVPCIVTSITDIHKLFVLVGVSDYISQLTGSEGFHLQGSDYKEYHLLSCDATYTGKQIHPFFIQTCDFMFMVDDSSRVPPKYRQFLPDCMASHSRRYSVTVHCPPITHFHVTTLHEALS